MPFTLRRAVNVLLAPACDEPWVVTRVYEHLARDESAPEVVLLAVPPGLGWVLPALRRAFSLRYRWVRVEGVDLRGPPKAWLEAICEALSAVNPDLVSVLISCSTPELASLLTSLAQLTPLGGVYSVSVRVPEERVEGWRRALSSWAGAGDRVLEEVFWPRRDDFEVHRLPVLPAPPALLERVGRALSGRHLDVDPELAAWLVRAGLIDVDPAREVRATELGRAISRAISALSWVGGGGRPVLEWR